MEFQFRVHEAMFLERPNRFVVVAQLASGEIIRAHCPDPGRLRELLAPGCTVYVSPSPGNQRHTQFDLRFVQVSDTGTLVSLDTRLPNWIFAEGLAAGRFPQFGEGRHIRREVPIPLGEPGRAPRAPRSRIDFLVGEDENRCWIEVKSATLVDGGWAQFPDAPTERGRRHVAELAELARSNGERAAVVFIVQRDDADFFFPRRETDPAFAAALKAACAAGVEVYAYTCMLTTRNVNLHRQIPVVLDGPC